ncbi:MAG: DUF4395 domain-containing protein [Candidatus Microthrix parvicella]|uniref:DUF4395 domain-containing protein n=1 Tax=Candidatus Neomicrothrix parvicella RN1 TaxID=1229780 RepID=R4YZ80_9ACTN|nr:MULTISPECIES: DUF4395 domain-containing protein [Microthrix]NLH65118.1 DUF4395 domain-containing protein [Candidatus Microthrix parvicella]MBK6501970.1 DUF4395 domain-containing protein [Candidatus Microthrix sp.]MBK7322111.1 DUF4395 domain-containing protein [Candidatus Microthrix sp.]MBL0205995.1 DUF4395 domain-containing protein [Candidatus Microthrix sp.]MBP6134981.1 DUF4395 domain-containing protein [Candidatus Microthrix sp.]
MRSLFSFPNPVNEVAARSVATGVVLLTGLILAATAAGIDGARWLVVPLALGFWARVLTGPTLSPLGQLATRVVAPRLAHAERLVPGAPKRFAQGIGTALSTAAAVTWLAFGLTGPGVTLVAAIMVAASLEAAFGLCLGCVMYGYLAKAGVFSAADCPECADISLRLRGNDTLAPRT